MRRNGLIGESVSLRAGSVLFLAKVTQRNLVSEKIKAVLVMLSLRSNKTVTMTEGY